MATIHLGQQSLSWIPLLNLRLENLATPPAHGGGRVYFDTVQEKIGVSNGTAWEYLGASGGGYTDEQVRDVIGAALVAGANIGITVNDAGDTITINVTGLDSGDISDFNTAVRVSRLDQMAAPTASVAMNSQKLTGLADPTGAQDAATKAYVDGAGAGLDAKQSVRVATTAAGTLATSFANGQTVDGVVLATGNRILIKNQATGSENGIYTVNASGAPTRATDANTSASVTGGLFTFVEQGTVNADAGWVLTNDGTITLGTTALVFSQFSGPGSTIAGTGLSRTGSTLSIDTAVVARKYTTTVGDGSTTNIVVTHNLNTRDVLVSLRLTASAYGNALVEWEATTVNTITLKFAAAPATNEWTAVVVG